MEDKHMEDKEIGDKAMESKAIESKAMENKHTERIQSISLDVETYSSIDLTQAGVYRYSESPDFSLLLLGYAVNGGAVHVIDVAGGERVPPDIVAALGDERVLKWAFNAAFERICLSRWLGLPAGQYLDPRSWRCTMVWSAYLGLPLSLEGAGAVLGLEKQKLKAGKDLIRLFCRPGSPAARSGEKWEAFQSYNRRDVETELSIQRKLDPFPLPKAIWEEYHLDQEINDRGVGLDMTLVRSALAADVRSRSELTGRLRAQTGIANPNSPVQMKQWLAGQGLETGTLGKKAVAALIGKASERLGDVLGLRQQLAMASLRKYEAMEKAVCADGRARGMFQFYGANRTGRWAGRLIQLQNLPAKGRPDLGELRNLLRRGGYEALAGVCDSVPEILSELIRTAFVPQWGRKLIVADFSAIEARVIAWLAGERWRNEVFASHGKIYEASASQMFQVPIDAITKGSPLRQKGKIAELALGYGGSVGALTAMGALEMGLEEEELQPLVAAWRRANPMIVKLWHDVGAAALTAVRERGSAMAHGISFDCHRGLLFITLPSGRKLAYVKPRIGTNRFGWDCVTYEGVGAMKKWQRIETYGPKLVENIVQAISRDILSHAMAALRRWPIVIHVHDEIVIEADRSLTAEEVCAAMSQSPPWAGGLLLKADGFESDFYKKE